MPWVRLDEEFPDHPKVVTAGPLAGWLHVCALAYCNRMMTDGFVPMSQVRRLVDFDGIIVLDPLDTGDVRDAPEVDARALAETLVSVGMWERRQGGYAIHDYLDYQPSRAETQAQRKVKSEAGKLGGKQSGKVRRSKAEAEDEAEGKQTTKQPGTRNEPPTPTEPIANGQAKTKPVPGPDPYSGYSSSSNLNGFPLRAADDDEGTPTEKALALMADRRIAAAIAAGNVIQNPGGYRRRTLESVNGELGDKAEAMLKAGATPEAVADKLVPVGSAAANRWPEFVPPPVPDEPPANVNGLAGVRSALGGGA